MKRKITQVEHFALSDAMKAVYKQDGESWLLELEDDTGFDALKAEKVAALAAKKVAEDALKVITDKAAADAKTAQDALDAAARDSGDIAALEASWQAKFDKQATDNTAAMAVSTAALETVFVTNVATQMANDISTVPDLLVDAIKKRLRVETNDGVSITRVVDNAGQPSALSISELQKEFVDNESYAAIIKASDAQGGGAGGEDGGGGGAGKKLSEMTATEEAAFANKHPARYAKMIAA